MGAIVPTAVTDANGNPITSVIVDNPNANAPGKQIYNLPQPLPAGSVAPTSAAFNGTSTWQIVPSAAHLLTDFGGFSFTTNTADPSYLDYLFVSAYGASATQDFQVNRGSGTTSEVTDDEFAELPNVPYNVYAAIDSTLKAPPSLNGAALPYAQWTSGVINYMANPLAQINGVGNPITTMSISTLQATALASSTTA